MNRKRRAKLRPGLVCLCILAPVTAATYVTPAAAEPGDHGLGDLINARLRAGGPFFTPGERAVIERACAYAPGEWDGFSLNAHDDALHCTNGRRIDGPAVRRVLAAAEPRIERRVNAIMASPEAEAAIDHITAEAAESAMAAVRLAFEDDDD